MTISFKVMGITVDFTYFFLTICRVPPSQMIKLRQSEVRGQSDELKLGGFEKKIKDQVPETNDRLNGSR